MKKNNKHNEENLKNDNEGSHAEGDILKQEPDIVVVSQKELDELRSKLRYAQEEVVRLHADFENARKRMLRDKEEFAKYANQIIINDFLDIMDNFERAYQSANQKHDYEQLSKGVDMIIKNIHGMLKKDGVETIEAVGIQFDHNKHEAVESVEDDTKEENTVVEVIRKGYSINGKVIRPAMVKVSKKKAEDEKDPSAV